MAKDIMSERTSQPSIRGKLTELALALVGAIQPRSRVPGRESWCFLPVLVLARCAAMARSRTTAKRSLGTKARSRSQN